MHLILGASIDALRFCLGTDSILMCPTLRPPFFFEDTFHEWNKLVLELALNGKIVFNQKIKRIKVGGDSIEVFLTSNEKRKIDFTRCDIFETREVDIECSDLVDMQQRYRVYDWFDAQSLAGRFPEERIIRDEKFISVIWLCGTNKVVCMSELDPEQIYKVEYSDSYCRFALVKILKDRGYTGKKNGMDKKGRQKYLGLDLILAKRDTFLDKKEIYTDTEKVRFHDTSWE